VNRSPNGRFGLLLKRDEDSSESAMSLIEVRSRKELISLDCEREESGARLLWSPDSKRVAFYCPNKRGGHTTVYFLSGSRFTEVPLPDWGPEQFLKPNEKFAHQSNDDRSPVRWEKSGSLVLKFDWEYEVEKNDQYTRTVKGSATVTVRFDAKNQASVQSAVINPTP
jgi:hypothetical protein